MDVVFSSDGVGVGEALQYISVIVDTTDYDDNIAVLYICFYSDGCDSKEGEVEECTEGDGGEDVDGRLLGVVSCAVVDGWLRGDLRRVGRGRETILTSVRTPQTLFSGRRVFC